MFGNWCIELLQSDMAWLCSTGKTNNALGFGMAICSMCSVLHVLLSGGYPLEMMNRQHVCADTVCLGSNKCCKVVVGVKIRGFFLNSDHSAAHNLA